MEKQQIFAEIIKKLTDNSQLGFGVNFGPKSSKKKTISAPFGGPNGQKVNPETRSKKGKRKKG